MTKDQIINMKNANALDACDNGIYIEAIKKSTVHTKIVLIHIDEMIELYKFLLCKSPIAGKIPEAIKF